jgi:hypothetical protein
MPHAPKLGGVPRGGDLSLAANDPVKLGAKDCAGWYALC